MNAVSFVKFKEIHVPVSIDIVVVFPAPLCPSRAMICPGKAEKLTPFAALTVAPVEVRKVLRRLVTWKRLRYLSCNHYKKSTC